MPERVSPGCTLCSLAARLTAGLVLAVRLPAVAARAPAPGTVMRLPAQRSLASLRPLTWSRRSTETL